MDGRRIEDLEVDPAQEEVRWGSIYWGKVMHIDKALDAAYIDLDGENAGILHNADVRLKNRQKEYRKGGDEAIGKVLKPGQMVAVQAKSGYVPGQDTAELAEDKAPKVSMDITLPGRYLIYSPMLTGNQISGRIRDKVLRKQLTKMLNSIEDIEGCILRAAAADIQTDILRREGTVLRGMWEQIQTHLEGESAQLIMLGPDAFERIMSDQAARAIDRIEVVTMERFQHIEELCEVYAPDFVTKIKPIELKNPHADLALFDHRDILDQIEELSQPYTILKQGGSIILQATAALIVIDVNRGADKRSNMEINIDAAHEIGRQMRLRNIGGAIIIDFLKMKNKKEQAQVLTALEQVAAEDACTVQIHGFTGLGLVEITRKRRTPALQEHMDSALAELD